MWLTSSRRHTCWRRLGWACSPCSGGSQCRRRCVCSSLRGHAACSSSTDTSSHQSANPQCGSLLQQTRYNTEVAYFVYTCMYIHVLMRDEKERRSKQGQINNKAKQHSTTKAVTFPKKNELPRVGLEPTTLYTLDRALYH